jgi:ABC-type Na+ transport system ATPase subunit NatA
VETVCDRVAILHQGELKAEGSVSALVQQHRQSNLEQVFLQIIGYYEQRSEPNSIPQAA